MKTGMIRIGIVGAGANTRARHIPALQAIEGVGIVSVCNRTLESTTRVAREFGIPTSYDNWQDLVHATDTDAIVIGTWPDMHAPVTLAALTANKHVLCEARMTTDACLAHAMRDAAVRKSHLIAQLVPAPFSLRVDRTVQRLLAEGYLGELLAIEVHDGNSFIDPTAPLHWRQDFDVSGYNVMSLGIWYEILLRWVGEATRVSARGKTFTNMRPDANGVLRAVRVPEHVDATADMACGAIAHLHISSLTGLAGPTAATLYGSTGTLRFTENRLLGGKKGENALQELIIPPDEEGRWRVEEEFINAIRGIESITRTTFDDGVKYMEFTEAAARSMMEGAAVPLPLSGVG